ncbi:hypothetical protein ANO14919_130930 [Xylariales sp. No.14919]|nr:hypothetical protein ANO14919_130930 [Xylariales sp. No.14919]
MWTMSDDGGDLTKLAGEAVAAARRHRDTGKEKEATSDANHLSDVGCANLVRIYHRFASTVPPSGGSWTAASWAAACAEYDHLRTTYIKTRHPRPFVRFPILVLSIAYDLSTSTSSASIPTANAAAYTLCDQDHNTDVDPGEGIPQHLFSFLRQRFALAGRNTKVLSLSSSSNLSKIANLSHLGSPYFLILFFGDWILGSEKLVRGILRYLESNREGRSSRSSSDTRRGDNCKRSGEGEENTAITAAQQGSDGDIADAVDRREGQGEKGTKGASSPHHSASLSVPAPPHPPFFFRPSAAFLRLYEAALENRSWRLGRPSDPTKPFHGSVDLRGVDPFEPKDLWRFLDQEMKVRTKSFIPPTQQPPSNIDPTANASSIDTSLKSGAKLAQKEKKTSASASSSIEGPRTLHHHHHQEEPRSASDSSLVSPPSTLSSTPFVTSRRQGCLRLGLGISNLRPSPAHITRHENSSPACSSPIAPGLPLDDIDSTASVIDLKVESRLSDQDGSQGEIDAPTPPTRKQTEESEALPKTEPDRRETDMHSWLRRKNTVLQQPAEDKSVPSKRSNRSDQGDHSDGSEDDTYNTSGHLSKRRRLSGSTDPGSFASATAAMTAKPPRPEMPSTVKAIAAGLLTAETASTTSLATAVPVKADLGTRDPREAGSNTADSTMANSSEAGPSTLASAQADSAKTNSATTDSATSSTSESSTDSVSNLSPALSKPGSTPTARKNLSSLPPEDLKTLTEAGPVSGRVLAWYLGLLAAHSRVHYFLEQPGTNSPSTSSSFSSSSSQPQTQKQNQTSNTAPQSQQQQRFGVQDVPTEYTRLLVPLKVPKVETQPSPLKPRSRWSWILAEIDTTTRAVSVWCPGSSPVASTSVPSSSLHAPSPFADADIAACLAQYLGNIGVLGSGCFGADAGYGDSSTMFQQSHIRDQNAHERNTTGQTTLGQRPV